MKKVVSYVVALSVAFFMTACGSDSNGTSVETGAMSADKANALEVLIADVVYVVEKDGNAVIEFVGDTNLETLVATVVVDGVEMDIPLIVDDLIGEDGVLDLLLGGTLVGQLQILDGIPIISGLGSGIPIIGDLLGDGPLALLSGVTGLLDVGALAAGDGLTLDLGVATINALGSEAVAVVTPNVDTELGATLNGLTDALGGSLEDLLDSLLGPDQPILINDNGQLQLVDGSLLSILTLTDGGLLGILSGADGGLLSILPINGLLGGDGLPIVGSLPIVGDLLGGDLLGGLLGGDGLLGGLAILGDQGLLGGLLGPNGLLGGLLGDQGLLGGLLGPDGLLGGLLGGNGLLGGLSGN